MIILIVGLVVFLGVHSIRVFANDWRNDQIQRIGPMAWKGVYALVSLLGFGLIVWGFKMARLGSEWVWIPPHWTRHISILLMLFATLLLVAAYVPGNRIKAKLGHPMVLAVKTWALAHLLSNGRVVDIVLFGAFLIWGIVLYIVSRRRDRAMNTTYPILGIGRDVTVIVVGLIIFVLFAHFGHLWLIGVSPMG